MEAVLEISANSPQKDAPPTCPRCEGTGWERLSNSQMSGVRRCRDASHLQDLLEKSQVPRTHSHCTLENFCARTLLQRRSRTHAQHFVSRFDESVDGLWISGAAASGKTHLTVGIIRALLERGHRGLRYYHAAELLRALDPRGPVGDRDQRARLRAEAIGTRLLVLDDLDQTALSRTEIGVLNYIIDVRERASLPLLITTRGRRSELSRAIGERAASALASLCTQLSFWNERGNQAGKPTALNGHPNKLWDADPL